MISALMVAAVMLAEPEATPAATPTPAPVAEADSEDGTALPSSFAMYVSLLEPVLVAGSNITIAPINGALRLGAVFDAKHALLVGIALGAATFGNTSSATISFMPTYRYHFGGLRSGGFAPYLQAELFLGVLTGASVGTSTALAFGAGAGGGGEYLVTRHFGLIAGAGLRFIRSENPSIGGSATLNQVAMYVSLGVGLHF